MARDDFSSTIRVDRRPLYLLLAALAVSCFLGALATDLAYWRTADIIWADFSDWLLTVGVIVGYITLIVAIIESIFSRYRRPTAAYAIGMIVALVLATLDMLVHTRDAWTSVVPWGLILSVAVVVVILLTSSITTARYGPAVVKVTS